MKTLEPTIYSTTVVTKHEIYLYDEIGGAENYVDLVQMLNNATEDEVFYINIATQGGDLDGCIAIINALRNTAAHTVGVADSCVASAGTIIFLACKELHIKEFSYFMFHDGGGHISGKFNETAKQIESINRLYRNIANKIYKPFFSDEEISKILDGSDLYQDADQMTARCEAAFDLMNAQDELPEEEPDDTGELIVPELLLEESAIDNAIKEESNGDGFTRTDSTDYFGDTIK